MSTFMRRPALALLIMISFASLAQESRPSPPKPLVPPEFVIGTWDGGYQPSTYVSFVGYRIQITDVRKNMVSGTGHIFARSQYTACHGEFPLTGNIKGNLLTIRAVEGFGTFKDCKWGLRCEIDGDTCAGKYGNDRVTLSKQ